MAPPNVSPQSSLWLCYTDVWVCLQMWVIGITVLVVIIVIIVGECPLPHPQRPASDTPLPAFSELPASDQTWCLV